MASECTADEEYGFVSRDPSLLDRAEKNEGSGEDSEVSPEVEGDEVFRPTPTSTSGPPEANSSAGSSGQEEVIVSRGGNSSISSKRESMASVGSSKADSTEEQKQSGKGTTEVTLPQTFQVKYLGRRDARGLWGIKHTRRPVDAMVAAAKTTAASTPGIVLPFVRLSVSREGVSITEARGKDKTANHVAFHQIDSISYGVQDLVYTRVFSMIVVREAAELRGQHPFECHAFVCDSRAHARKLTYALAAAFHEYSRAVRASSGAGNLEGVGKKSKKFAIDLRTPEEIEKELQMPQEADSEA